MDLTPRTRTNEIADAIRGAIDRGELGADEEQLPSENQLCEEYDASRGTIRRALRVLIDEGLLYSRAGMGYYVRRLRLLKWWPGTFEHRDERGDTVAAGVDAWAADVLRQGRTPRQEVDVSIVDPPPGIAARLGTPAGERVVVRRRLRFVDDVKFQTADSYYPLWVADGSAIMQPGDVVIAGGLMAASGHPQVRFADELYVRMPTQMETWRLELPPATPVAEHYRVGFDRDDRRVRVIVTIVPGDRHVILYEVPAAPPGDGS